jgi:hypothetical protein
MLSSSYLFCIHIYEQDGISISRNRNALHGPARNHAILSLEGTFNLTIDLFSFEVECFGFSASDRHWILLRCLVYTDLTFFFCLCSCDQRNSLSMCILTQCYPSLFFVSIEFSRIALDDNILRHRIFFAKLFIARLRLLHNVSLLKYFNIWYFSI